MKYLSLFLDHVYICSIALVFSIILSIFLCYLSYKNKYLKKFLLNITTLIYAIPSLSMFSLLIPYIGLGKKTVIFSLIIYSQYILVRSFITLIDNFDKDLVLASNAMGLSEKELLFEIKLPLLKNEIISTIKITISAIISIANIGAIINANGIGVLIFDGLRTMKLEKILIAIFLNVLVYYLFESIIKLFLYLDRKIKSTK